MLRKSKLAQYFQHAACITEFSDQVTVGAWSSERLPRLSIKGLSPHIVPGQLNSHFKHCYLFVSNISAET